MMVNTQRIPPEFKNIRQTRQGTTEHTAPPTMTVSKPWMLKTFSTSTFCSTSRYDVWLALDTTIIIFYHAPGRMTILPSQPVSLFSSIQISSRNSKHLVGLFQEEHDDPKGTGENDEEAKGREGRLLERRS